MKVLKISQKKASFSINGTTYSAIKDITQNDLKTIISIILYQDNIEYDSLSDENDISNPVEKIIYQNLELKIKDLLKNRNDIINDINNYYEKLYDKYDLLKETN